MTVLMEKIQKITLKAGRFLFNPHFMICFLFAWCLTNGWAYLLLFFGTVWGNGWMMGIAGSYLVLLWLPFTPEKIITLMLAIFFLKRWYPEDEETRKLFLYMKKKIL